MILKSLGAYLGHPALLCEQLQNAAGRLLDQLQTLRVIRELDVRELDLLLPVLRGHKACGLEMVLTSA